MSLVPRAVCQPLAEASRLRLWVAEADMVTVADMVSVADVAAVDAAVVALVDLMALDTVGSTRGIPHRLQSLRQVEVLRLRRDKAIIASPPLCV